MKNTFKSKKELQEAIRAQITQRNGQAIRAIMKIYEYQTADEKARATVSKSNGVGFAGTDVEILTSFCRQYEKFGRLSEKQIGIVKKKVGKYAGQITRQAIANGIYVKQNGLWTTAK